ncbi:transketolase [Capsaspora owczarzaki ATCC 30864]|uniref:Transketolase n=1 Tax=Capsaspora owczarzaki (strain ATCC 30864) TaxID=595528 RepID=A0A0D2WT98_CAPO3|nr:transketolase [Capsaspora owczarzaki ATCC 30864]KJE94848.1 transketolase [Capsaspora owczarzaki ATCC 30864]|eukprot:XP_004346092.2 transketolase [Capsaspora owczarzaki ATCC 30864]
MSHSIEHTDTHVAKRARTRSGSDLEWRCINTIRTLAADTVQRANSGHPGAPMGLAPTAHLLWAEFMRYNPTNPAWINRDRFVLSNGHACALQYSMLHLAGYQVTLEDLKHFRQIGSITPGHPENTHTPGVEVTTGPLGQGIANAVGLAIAQTHLAAEFNRPGFELINNHTYVILGDGCHMEGISGEAASLAGHLGLGNLIAIYDDNKISIDGETELAFTEDVAKRFEAYGWHTIHVSDADDDIVALRAAIESAKKVTDRPSLILARTTIGYGSEKEGTEKVHGAPLGDKDLAAAKTRLGFDPAQSFVVPAEVAAHYGQIAAQGQQLEADWRAQFDAYRAAHPALAAEFERRANNELPADWKKGLPTFTPKDKAVATRQLHSDVLNVLANNLPEIVGGSADLAPSNLTELKCSHDFQKATPEGRYIRFGVREHAMGAIGNGIAAYGMYIPYVATFFNFLSYCWPAARLSALSHFRVLYVMTHDSIGLGEDGPTHQPIEMLPLSRACPDMVTLRPADGNETVGSYVVAIERKHGPAVLCFTRHAVPHLEGSSAEKVALGAYVLQDQANHDVILIATGSEVSIAVEAARTLANEGIKARIVSAPSLDLFDQQPAAYRCEVLTPGVTVVSVEASGVTGWTRYSHFSIGMRSFGASGPVKDVFAKFGFTGDQVAASVRTFLGAPAERRHAHLAVHYDY